MIDQLIVVDYVEGSGGEFFALLNKLINRNTKNEQDLQSYLLVCDTQ